MPKEDPVYAYLSVRGNLFCYTRPNADDDAKRPLGPRGLVRAFSDRSRSRLSRYLHCSEAHYTGLVTLTFPADGEQWRDAKRHLRVFLQRLRRHWEDGTSSGTDGDASACWFLEWTARGIPHFHILTNRWVGKLWLATTWAEICNGRRIELSDRRDYDRMLQASTRVEQLRDSSRTGTARYATKILRYATKAEQKDLPEGVEAFGRFWGVVGCRRVVAAATEIFASDMESELVRCAFKAMLSRVRSLVFEGKARGFNVHRSECAYLSDEDADWVRRMIGGIGIRTGRSFDARSLQEHPEPLEATAVHGR